MIRYPGSKAKLSRKILHFFPLDVAGLNYYEPFVGTGSVFRRVIRDGLPFKSFHLSDKFDWVINYLSALRDPSHDDRGDLLDRLDELRERLSPECEHEEEIREIFEEMKPMVLALDPLAYLFVCSYANGQYCYPQRRDLASFHPQYFRGGISTCTRHKGDEWRTVLGRATVSVADAFELLPTLGSSDFCYIDPPYCNGVNGNPSFRMYAHDFRGDDHRRLAEILRGAKFKFCLSYGDKPLVRELYDFPGIKFRWLHRVSQGTRTRYPSYGEWLIKNY